MIKYGLYIMVFVLSLSNSVAIMAAVPAHPCDVHGSTSVVGGRMPGATDHRTGASSATAPGVALPPASMQSCPAEDVIESEGTRIIGDSDMPKALYIVPWKKPALPTLSSRPITPFINDALSSINRESLIFQMKQNELLQGSGSVKPDK